VASIHGAGGSRRREECGWVWWRGGSSKPAIARIQHLLEVRAGELGHVEELDGIGAHDATIPV
jgi:hypothetical protein